MPGDRVIGLSSAFQVNGPMWPCGQRCLAGRRLNGTGSGKAGGQIRAPAAMGKLQVTKPGSLGVAPVVSNTVPLRASGDTKRRRQGLQIPPHRGDQARS